MIKNIVFDIGNVLVKFHPDQSMVDLGIAPEKIASLAAATYNNPLWVELDRGVMKEEDVIAKMIEESPEYQEEIETFFEKGKRNLVESFSYSASWLQSLKQRGYKVYLLSNYPVSFFELHSKEKYTFLPYIDGKVVSGYIKMIKPDHEIYEYLLRTYQLNPAECVFLDDRQENIDSAVACGMQGITFTNYEEAKEQLENVLSK